MHRRQNQRDRIMKSCPEERDKDRNKNERNREAKITNEENRKRIEAQNERK